MSRTRADVVALGLGLSGIAAVTLTYSRWSQTSNSTTVSMSFLIVVLLVAATAHLWVAIATSIAAMLCFNYFFLPPLATFTIADPTNWVALFAFLAASLIASNLSAAARDRAEEALERRNELARLFDLGRDILVMTDTRDAISTLARSIAGRFDLDFAAIALPKAGRWEIFEAGQWSVALTPTMLSGAFAAAHTSPEFDARTGRQPIDVNGDRVQLVALRVGTRPIGLLAASGREIEAGTLGTLGGVVAIAIERTQFLEERKTAELTRQSEELKTALLASIGHDLRTPLTAIRVAASNLNAASLSRSDQGEQVDLILAEVNRLSRLFENILEMARIDAGVLNADRRWTHPSEIIEAARDQVVYTLRGHRLEVLIENDAPVELDPRLTTSAVAHLLENAAQYSPPNTGIQIATRVGDDGLEIRIRDRGPGLAPEDLPHLFDRFYRGAASPGRSAGTGMGLWIARALLAAEHGRVWGENATDGGAEFIVRISAPVKRLEPVE
jgi:two-component system sensor histidine kinase KdpD